jgi:hypothetical protein
VLPSRVQIWDPTDGIRSLWQRFHNLFAQKNEGTGGAETGAQGGKGPNSPVGRDILGDRSIDDLINTSLRSARAGAEESRAIQALKKKIDRGDEAFVGLPKTQEAAEKVIREVFGTENSVVRTGTSRNGESYTDIFNSNTGRGVRIIDGSFDTFVNLK